MNPAWRSPLRRDGYIHLPKAVPAERVRNALRRINAWMGRGMPPDQMLRYAHQSSCPDERNHPDFIELFHHRAIRALTDAAFGPNALAPVEWAQIALRFPELEAPGRPPEPHLDGMPTALNALSPGQIENFAALVAIYLQDVPVEWAGNFTVWPGSHLLHATYFKTHGPRALLAGLPPIDRGPPHQLRGRAGDAFLCHYLLAHGAAANLSPHIRYAVFFRLRLALHEELGLRPMVDPWIGWPGLAG